MPLAALAAPTEHPSPDLAANRPDYFADRDVQLVEARGRVRSAATYLAAINANQPAILLPNAYGDSLAGPNQLVDFSTRSTGPKQREWAAWMAASPRSAGRAAIAAIRIQPAGLPWTRGHQRRPLPIRQIAPLQPLRVREVSHQPVSGEIHGAVPAGGADEVGTDIR